MGITGKIHYLLVDYWEENWDPRSRGLLLMQGGPWGIIGLMSCYVIFARYLGPFYMRHRRPYDLRLAMLIYNFTTVIANGYAFIMTFYHLNWGRDLFNFDFPSRTELTELEFHKAKLAYLYGWTKLFDLLDTVCFVLRKKQSQVTGK